MPFYHTRDQYKTVKQIHLILDQVGYHKAHNVLELASKLAIKIHFLPPHSPNLNPIEQTVEGDEQNKQKQPIFKSSASFRKSIDDFSSLHYPTWPKSWR